MSSCYFVSADAERILSIECGVSVEPFFSNIHAALVYYEEFDGNWYEFLLTLSKNQFFEKTSLVRLQMILGAPKEPVFCKLLLEILLGQKTVYNLARVFYFNLVPESKESTDARFILTKLSRIRSTQISLEYQKFDYIKYISLKETATHHHDYLFVMSKLQSILSNISPRINAYECVINYVQSNLTGSLRKAHRSILNHYQHMLGSSLTLSKDDSKLWKACELFARKGGLTKLTHFMEPKIPLSFEYVASSVIEMESALMSDLYTRYSHIRRYSPFMAYAIRLMLLEDYLLHDYKPPSSLHEMYVYSLFALIGQLHDKLEAFCILHAPEK